MSDLPERWSPVTVLVRFAGQHRFQVHRAQVTAISASVFSADEVERRQALGGRDYRIVVGASYGIFHVHHEGITWIRGHHAKDSEEVQALLAAGALARAD